MGLGVSLGLPAQLLRTEESLLLTCEYFSLPCSLILISSTLPSQCVGETALGQDFETFIGAEKAKELKTLFSSWIHKIYRTSWFYHILNLFVTLHTAPSEWSLFSLEQLPEDDEDPEDTVANAAISPELEFTSDNLPSLDVSGRVSPCDEERTVQDLEALKIPSPPSPDPLIALSELPLGAGESAWMKSKHTLKYFREVHKLGKLSDLILHWHQLEEALGFPEAVSWLSNCLSCKNVS